MTSGTPHELRERAAWDARRNADAAERQANPETDDESPWERRRRYETQFGTSAGNIHHTVVRHTWRHVD
jgi:hypothetical protein